MNQHDCMSELATAIQTRDERTTVVEAIEKYFREHRMKIFTKERRQYHSKALALLERIDESENMTIEEIKQEVHALRFPEQAAKGDGDE